MDCAAYRDLVAADVDRRLDPTVQAEVEAHLSQCARCTALRRTQRAVKDVLRQRVVPPVTPAAVRTRVLTALAEEERQSMPPPPRVHRGRVLVAGAIAAVAVLTLLPFWRSSAPDLLDILVKDVHAATANEVPLIQADSTDALRQFYGASGKLKFERTVPELDRLGFRPVGGAIVAIGDVEATFTVFEGLHGRVICRRFPVGAIPLPKGGDYGTGQLFTVDGVTIRIVRDGDAICCLASSVPRDVFLAYLERASHH